MAGPDGRRTGFRLHLHAVLARAYVRVVGVNREPSWVLHETLLPLIAAFTYVYVYRALDAPRHYEGFAILGMAMTTFWLSVLWGMAAQLYWEKEMGNLELYLQAPISRMAILAGMALGSMFNTTVRFLTIVGAGAFLLDIRFDVQSWPALVLVFALTIVALYALGMAAASLFFMYGREGWHVFDAVQEPIYLAAGFYFPTKPLIGGWSFVVAAVVPLAFGLDAIRQLVLPVAPEEVLLSVRWEAAILAVMAAAFLVAARWALRHMEEAAKREGRLTLRWQ